MIIFPSLDQITVLKLYILGGNINCTFFILHRWLWGIALNHMFYLRKKVHHGPAALDCTLFFGKSLIVDAFDL